MRSLKFESRALREITYVIISFLVALLQNFMQLPAAGVLKSDAWS